MCIAVPCPEVFIELPCTEAFFGDYAIGRDPRDRRFRGEPFIEAHRLVYHSTLGSRVIKKKKRAGTCKSIVRMTNV